MDSGPGATPSIAQNGAGVVASAATRKTFAAFCHKEGLARAGPTSKSKMLAHVVESRHHVIVVRATHMHQRVAVVASHFCLSLEVLCLRSRNSRASGWSRPASPGCSTGGRLFDGIAELAEHKAGRRTKSAFAMREQRRPAQCEVELE